MVIVLREQLTSLEVEALMKLQYEFPLTPTPFLDVAYSLDLKFDNLAFILRGLVKRGILKRVGFYYNYKAQGHTAALIAFSCGGSYEGIAEVLRGDPLVTHNFLRDHPEYDVWAVIKRSTKEELLAYIDDIALRNNVKKWIALFSKKTYKLSVKFDLREGFSRSGPYSKVIENPPRPEDIGVDPMIPRLVRVLNIDERPYKIIADRLRLNEEELVSLVREMLDKGILGDPGATIEGDRVGFTENAMVVMEPIDDEYKLCECAAELPYSTHVVLREPYPPGSWTHTCYFMIHAVSREKIYSIIEEARKLCKPKSLIPIFSIMDLKPGVVR